MSTINILSERILRILSGGNIPRDQKWEERDIQYLVRDAVAKTVKGTWYEEKNEGGDGLDSRFVVTFTDQEVKKDSRTGENYVEIPVDSWLRLPDDSGIRSVRPSRPNEETKRTKAHELRAFIPIPNRFKDIYLNLPAGALEQQFGYEIRKDKIYFTTKGTTTEGQPRTLEDWKITKVDIDIATVDPAAVDIDDPLPLPNDYNVDVIQTVLTLMGIQVPIDVINDNAPVEAQK